MDEYDSLLEDYSLVAEYDAEYNVWRQWEKDWNGFFGYATAKDSEDIYYSGYRTGEDSDDISLNVYDSNHY